MYRDQIRHNLQRIIETTKDHWDELLEGPEPQGEPNIGKPWADINMKMFGVHKAQGLESQDGSITQWQRAS